MVGFDGKDKTFMERAFELALKGWGRVSPNPMVGAVLVKDGKIVGEGYHKNYGGPHAEVNAIKDAGDSVNGSTIYLNLEPCTHYGNTPPCADAIIRAGIKEVVCSNRDMDPRVLGKGFRKLRRSKIKVRIGLMRDEGLKLNEIYFKNKLTAKPFVTVKAAMSLDGYIYSPSFGDRYLSGRNFLKYVHKLRSGYDAVLVGANTAIVDDPSLTVRHIRGHNPNRIIISDGKKLPSNLKLFSNKTNRLRTIIAISSNVYGKGFEISNGVEVWVLESKSKRFSINALLERAAEENINSILVEGGGEVFNSFLKEKAVDKIILSHTPYIFGKGTHFINGGAFGLKIIDFDDFSWETMGKDSVFIGYPKYN